MVTQYVKTCTVDEIEEGKTKIVSIDGRPIILAKEGGQVFALEGICSHDEGEFKANKTIIDGQIECPRHGARFDIRTGEATLMPAVVPITRFEVKIEDGDIYVAMDE